MKEEWCCRADCLPVFFAQERMRGEILAALLVVSAAVQKVYFLSIRVIPLKGDIWTTSCFCGGSNGKYIPSEEEKKYQKR
jgi:hypothetical protein